MDPEEFKAMLHQTYSNSKKSKPNTPLTDTVIPADHKNESSCVDDALNLFEEDVSLLFS